MLVLDAAAALLAPLLIGTLLGMAIRRRLGNRLSGRAAAAACLLLPAVATTFLTVCFPVIGVWDAATEGLLCGAGVLFTAHNLYAAPWSIGLTIGSVIVSLLGVEVATRAALSTPPAFAVGDGPHFWLADALRTTPPDARAFRMAGIPDLLARRALQGDLARPAELTPPSERPPAALLTSELVCDIAYGAAYHGVLDINRAPRLEFPDRFTPRRDAARRVLHIGDSMVFGANVPREAAFPALLQTLEPTVEHINGGISGMAPDDYLVVLNGWLARQALDVAVMYLFAGNDLSGIGAPHPCSDWQSLLTYEDGSARLRFAAPAQNSGEIGVQWLLTNSPFPYLGRVMLAAGSSAAAFAASGLASLTHQSSSGEPPDVQLQRLEAILRAAREATRAHHVRFVVVVLPAAGTLQHPGGGLDFAAAVEAITTRLGIPTLDATPLIRDALARGEHPVQDDQTHFNARGHALMADWLHQRLERAAEPVPQ